MPRLVRLYILNIAIGFVLALCFTGLLIWLDVAHLRHLILGSPAGWLAALMLVIFNTIVFAGVQFGIAIMRMAEDDKPSGGRGTRAPVTRPLTGQPALVPAIATGRPAGGGNRSNRGGARFPESLENQVGAR